MTSLFPVARSYCGASSSSAEVSATEVSTLISAGSAAAVPIAANNNPAAAASLDADILPNTVIRSPLKRLRRYMLKERVADEFRPDNNGSGRRSPRARDAGFQGTPGNRRATIRK